MSAEDYPEAKEKEEQTTSLVEELGTDPRTLSEGRYNRRITTRIWDPENIPEGYNAELWMEAYGQLFNDPAVMAIVEIHRDLSRSIRGTGINDIIRGEQVKRGIAVKSEPELKEPGWLGKLMNRNWEEDQRRKLGVEQEK